MELVRHRVMVGAASFLLLFDLLFVLWSLGTSASKATRVTAILVELGYLGTLLLARRARRPEAPAMLLLVTLSVGMVAGIFTLHTPYGGAHAAAMLLPALAVYLTRPRWALPITLLLVASLGVAHPLYRMHLGLPAEELTDLWFMHLFASVSLVGSWGLAALHGIARDSAQASLERTLRELRESERKLSTLIESTDDVVLSLDMEGRVLAANTATRRVFQESFGMELPMGQPLFPQGGGVLGKVWGPRLAQVMQGQSLRLEEEIPTPSGRIVVDVSINPILDEGGRAVGLTLFSRDVTPRKEAEARLGEMHRTLVDVSRQAGMAEIATGVLHNVGNTLNSVNISTALVTDRLRKSRLTGLLKATRLLREHAADVGGFLTGDPQGQKLPQYFIAVAEQLEEEREAVLQEMGALAESVEHIKSIVSMQQKHARTAGAVEEMSVPQLIDEALRLHAISFERLGIHIERDYAQVPRVLVDRHKLLQILINLLSNARHALVASAGQAQGKRLIIRVQQVPESAQLRIEVSDNGVGIAPENLPRIFTQGFTTKKEGHGFGLHISALAAEEMKGRLSCSSAGPGQGATFTLELPLEVAQ
ncbi:MAG: two-component system sensor histidine kinase NtrB [Hyalangium sp.]|uniref:two-component system sensor histidine kinase NtrB n=1 Tax=Hyalangium sp. TaxID=2028555 RepID=UPI00389A1AB6